MGHLKTKNLLPFRDGRNGFRMARITQVVEEESPECQLDPDLTQEEEAYVRHYLKYADTLLRSPDPSPELSEIEEEQSKETRDDAA